MLEGTFKILASAPGGRVLKGHPLFYPECLRTGGADTMAAAIRPSGGRRWVILEPCQNALCKPGLALLDDFAAHCPSLANALAFLTENLRVPGRWLACIKPGEPFAAAGKGDSDGHALAVRGRHDTGSHTDILLAIAGALNTLRQPPLSLLKLAELVSQAEHLATGAPAEISSRVAALTGGVVVVRHDPVTGVLATPRDRWGCDNAWLSSRTHGWELDERGLVVLSV